MTAITRLFIITVISCFPYTSFAQEDSMVKYTPEFQFKEGIYLNFEQVKGNNPIPKSRILASIDYHDDDFLDHVLLKDEITFFDIMGAKKEVKTKNIWGFSRNGVLYVNVRGGFNRVTIVGSICHFVATVTTYNTTYNDPYYNSPYYNPYYGNYRYGRYPNRQESKEMKQFIIDFRTGKIMEYERESLKIIFMQDPELHDEYSSLKKKKQRQLKFYYLRKFNERNPLYIPKE
jgi:hypothetical protein